MGGRNTRNTRYLYTLHMITGQLIALVISSLRTAGQLIAKSKIQLVNSSPNVVALKLHDLCVWK